MASHEVPRTIEHARFWFRGLVRELTDVEPTVSVLHWLREDEGATGTKEGCNQGDCGACTVVLAEHLSEGIRFRPANACLLPVPMLHGRALFTVEDVAADDTLHPIQQALVDHGGSQCGFCTPGFVMSLWCADEQSRLDGSSLTREDLAGAISGNLCRCTGYRPILDAAVDALQATSGQPSPVDAAELSVILAGLDEPGTLSIPGSSGAFIAPDSAPALAAALRAHSSAVIVSGGTDLVLLMRAGKDASRDVVLVSTGRVPELRCIEESVDELAIGAAVSLEDAWTALVTRAPSLRRIHERFASPAIRSLGTIGGNIANSSPIADLTPVLIALDARVDLEDADGTRSVDVAAFATGVRTNVLRQDEFLSRVVIPAEAFSRDLRAYKVSRRFDDDISTLSATFSIQWQDTVMADLRVVFGGMAPTVRRAVGVETALRGRECSDETLAGAVAALAADFRPISDHRASAGYRERAARGLLQRWWMEINSATVPLDVWAAHS